MRQSIPVLRSCITERVYAISSSNWSKKSKNIGSSHRVVNRSQSKQFFQLLWYDYVSLFVGLLFKYSFAQAFPSKCSPVLQWHQVLVSLQDENANIKCIRLLTYTIQHCILRHKNSYKKPSGTQGKQISIISCELSISFHTLLEQVF